MGGKWRGERSYRVEMVSFTAPLFYCHPPTPTPSPPLPHQGHLLEGGCGSVEHKHRFDVVVKELTNPVEEDQEVGVGERVPMYISRPLHCLVQPDTYVWCM